MDPPAQASPKAAPEYAAGPGSASPCTPQAEAEVDFGGSEHESFVEVAPDVRQELGAQLSDEAVAEGERRADTVEVRVALSDLPEFLRVVHGVGMPQSDVLQKIKAMKARGVEHVRWRSVDVPEDIGSKAEIYRIRQHVHERVFSSPLPTQDT